MEFGLAGKTALITGGSKGIGLATALGLAREGCAVHLAARSAPDLEVARARASVALPMSLSRSTRSTSRCRRMSTASPRCAARSTS